MGDAAGTGGVLGEVDAEVRANYDIHKRIGKGAYGIVWKATERSGRSRTVAIKKIFDAFRNRTDSQRTFREVIFLKQFAFHPNIIKLLNVLKAENNLDLYLVLEYMDSDLHNVIKRGNILKDIHKRYIMYQVFRALKCLHSYNVIHRDLKPSNILLDVDCQVRLADFGLARSLHTWEAGEDGTDPTLTEYVATRWYRAPEILLADKRYTAGVDLWSAGCILGELLLGKPLFAGTSTLNQIECIMSTVTPPTYQDIRSMCSGYAMTVLERSSNRPKRPLREVVYNAPNEALDLLSKLVVFNPKKRLSAEQALQNPYVSRFQHPSDNVPLPPNLGKTLEGIDQAQLLTVDEYRRKVYKVISESQRHFAEPEKKIAPPSGESFSSSSETDDEDDGVGDEVVTERVRRSSVQSPLHHRSTIPTSGSTSDATSGTRRAPLRKAQSQECVRANCEQGSLTSSPLPSPGRMSAARSSVMLAPVPANAAAGLPSYHPRANTASAWLRFHGGSVRPSTTVTKSATNNSTSTKKAIPQSAKPTTVAPPSSINGTRPRLCGRRQFGNCSNSSSLGAPRALMQSYSQKHGTISASALQQLHIAK